VQSKQEVFSLDDHNENSKPSYKKALGIIKVKIVPAVQIEHHFTVIFEMPESETDTMLESRDNLETRRDAKVGPRRKPSGPLLEIWRVQGDGNWNSKSANFLIAVKPLDRAVVDFTAPRGAC
jgi:hypothetical protein